MTYGHLQADCLYTGISSRPNARYRVWEAFTFTFLVVCRGTPELYLPRQSPVHRHKLSATLRRKSLRLHVFISQRRQQSTVRRASIRACLQSNYTTDYMHCTDDGRCQLISQPVTATAWSPRTAAEEVRRCTVNTAVTT